MALKQILLILLTLFSVKYSFGMDSEESRICFFAGHDFYNPSLQTYLSNTNPNLLTTINDAQETALHIAAAYGCKNNVKTLLDYAQKNDNSVDILLQQRNKHGFTPLHNAMKYAHHTIVQQLLTAGAKITCIYKKIGNRTREIMPASHLLLHEIPIHNQERKKRELTLKQLLHQKKQILEELYTQNISLMSKDKKGRTALQLAERKDMPELAALLRFYKKLPAVEAFLTCKQNNHYFQKYTPADILNLICEFVLALPLHEITTLKPKSN